MYSNMLKIMMTDTILLHDCRLAKDLAWEEKK